MENGNYVIGICDDQEEYRNDIWEKCREKLIGENIIYKLFASGEEVLNGGEGLDFLFLDIEMSGMNGIQVKNELEEISSQVKIIFLTSHTERMREAFGENVIDFLEKPLDEAALNDMIQKIYRYLHRKVIRWEEAGKQYCVRQEDIQYIQAQDKYTYVVWGEGKYLVRRTMKEWEELLSQEEFCRVNRSHLVNMEYFDKIGPKLILKNGEIIRVSRKEKSVIEEKYREYIRKRMEEM